MWTPAPMQQTTLVVLDTDLPAMTAILGRLGVVQLLDVHELGGWAADLTWGRAAELAQAYDGLWRRLDDLFEVVGLSNEASPPPDIVIRPEAVLAEADAVVTPIADEAYRLADEARLAREEVERLDVVVRELAPLRPLGLALEDLRQLRFLTLVSGLVPMENLQRLRGSLASTPHSLVPIGRLGDRVLIFAFAPRWEQQVLDRALRSAYVERVEIPADLRGSPEDALREICGRRDEVAEQARQAEAGLTALGRRHAAELAQARTEVLVNKLAVEAWRQAGRTASTRLLTGWVPKRVAGRLQSEVAAAVGNRAVVALGPAQAAGESPAGPEGEPPVVLGNPSPLRPFEILVTTYGLPRYDEIDPTPLAAFLFLFMFGTMFGDLGQGAVLAIVGLLMARGIIRYGGRDFGIVLAAAGVSSMLFGTLFGTVFGSEEIIPALWFYPYRQTTFFLEIAVAFGLGVLTIGMMLHIVNARRNRDYMSLILDPYGLVGLWLFWGLLLAALAILNGLNIGALGIAGLIGPPLLVLYFRGPLAAWFGITARGEPEPQAGTTYYVESAVEVFDVLVRYVSNTLSFLRLAAFALSHAGLGIVVFTLAALFASMPLAGPAVLVLGNAIIIGLEGLIVAIQALRLDYYEFFGKFYEGGGKPYRPFVIPVATRQTEGSQGRRGG